MAQRTIMKQILRRACTRRVDKFEALLEKKDPSEISFCLSKDLRGNASGTGHRSATTRTGGFNSTPQLFWVTTAKTVHGRGGLHFFQRPTW